MRVSNNMLYNQMARGLKDYQTQLDELNNRIATNKKINKPSDDVLGTMKALDYKLSISQNQQYQQNITDATNYMDYTATVLTAASTALSDLAKLKKTDTTGGNTSNGDQAAVQRDFLLDLANSKIGDRYIFSGYASDTKPYLFDNTGGAATYHYIYQGDSGQLTMPIDQQMSQTINFVGSSEVSTTPTAFSFNQAPDPATLSDGSTVTYTAVPDAATHQTAIRVDITLPGGAAPNDSFTFSNFMDLANQVSHAWQDQNVDGTALTSDKSQARIEALAEPLQKAQEQVQFVVSDLSIKKANLNDQQNRLESNNVTQKDYLSKVQDANMDETIVTLQSIMTNLNALRSSSAKILAQTLFDFLN